MSEALNFTVSVVIPTLDSPSILETVNACTHLSPPELIQEILVVGQQNQPPLPTLPRLVLHEVYPPTPAHNRNVGAQLAAAEWVLFIDSDCVPAPDLVLRLKEIALSGEQAIAGAVALPDGMGYWGICDHFFGFAHQVAGAHSSQYIPYAASLVFCIRKDLLRSAGGFHEVFTSAGGEDRELSWRLQKHGVKIRFSPQAWVMHNHPRRSFLSAWKHIHHYGEVTAQFRLLVFSEMSPGWKAGYHLLRVPVLGEMLGLLRLTLRALFRLPQANPPGLRLKHLPGLAVLDLAHTLGMISMFRKRPNSKITTRSVRS